MKVCYCFNHTEQDIIDDVTANNGRSTITEEIIASRKRGICNCEKNHPEKR